MRKTLLILLFIAIKGISQNKQILYNFTAVPQSMMSNPGADFKYKYYFGVPLLSGISVNAGAKEFSVYDLFANDGVNFNQKLRNVISSTNRRDHVYVNEQIEIFNGGIKLGDFIENKGYLSFGLYQELDVFGYVPKDLAILALEGNQNYIGKSFNLSDLNGKAEMLSVLHVGYHKNVSDKLIVGGRTKIYFSGFNATSTHNSGSITTKLSDNSIYDQEINSDITINTSGISKYLADDYNDDNLFRDIKKQSVLNGDLGLGFDFGFTYYPKKNTQITASILDVGFIRHTKDIENFTYKGYYNYQGINPNFSQSNNPNSVYDDFRAAVVRDTFYNKYTTMRPIKLNASYQYSFGRSNGDDCDCTASDKPYKNAVGAQFFMRSTPRIPIMALTGFYQRNISDILQLKATYTLDSYSYTNIGMGLSANLGKFNMYFLADNLLEYRDVSKANSLSFQFGFNFIFKDSSEFYQ
ncbi:MAG: DUF5723 family protein [Flavobacterium sp.]